MLEPLGNLFEKRAPKEWRAGDIKVMAERCLQQYLRSDQVYCVEAGKNSLTIRVGNPTLYQEARLCQWEVAQALAAEIGYTLESLTIIPAYY